ncbi:hypothetical protein F5878DRAFT_606417 [Lentinula raphanica]|uniref:Trafficking protein particle complex subunit 13 N-terminal domain-containing protein n=1 Tax=Lentinula raphanica TaxID=153919 RepID=A0AA38UJ62_9AGAR|nr:hypothetical protein F5878DRAFT_606417 [Lentinula raphanica]
MFLQGTNPLPGYPKTLRDLTQASEILTLPSSFGSIQPGETFSSCLSVNNEATTQVDSVASKVEMQTATSKITLAEIGGKDTSLAPLDTLENVVHHEIKELGSTCPCVPLCRHSWSPPNAIKTSSKSTSKTSHQKPSGSSGCHFEAAEGWIARDTNVITIAGEEQSLYSGSTALMQPQAPAPSDSTSFSPRLLSSPGFSFSSPSPSPTYATSTSNYPHSHTKSSLKPPEINIKIHPRSKRPVGILLYHQGPR